MGARNESWATGAIAKLKADGFLDSPNSGQVLWHELDLTTPALVKLSAEESMKRETRLDVIVNNAATAQTNPTAFEHVKDSKIPVINLMSTNHIGPFALTTALLPLIKKTAAEPGSDVRVVMVSSVVHSQASGVDWENPEGWGFKSRGFIPDTFVYGTTKLANILFAKQLQRNFDQEKVNALAIALHPGSVDTGGFQDTLLRDSRWGFLTYYSLWLAGQMLSPAEGAYTSLYASTSRHIFADRSRYAGAYIMPFGTLAEPSKEARDPVAAQKMWMATEKVISAT
ncbi:hypothetical protein FRB95_010383 [Tulasnella sp. JGI-2019a]|nr:hypothetical protein FRB95_010383 [Tulasnella sp. JGI-2019a]